MEIYFKGLKYFKFYCRARRVLYIYLESPCVYDDVNDLDHNYHDYQLFTLQSSPMVPLAHHGAIHRVGERISQLGISKKSLPGELIGGSPPPLLSCEHTNVKDMTGQPCQLMVFTEQTHWCHFASGDFRELSTVRDPDSGCLQSLSGQENHYCHYHLQSSS